MHDGQAEAGARLVGPARDDGKALEYLPAVLLRDARPVVLYGDARLPVAAGQAHQHPGAAEAQGVVDQVDHDLADMVGVGQHRHLRRGHFYRDLDTAAFRQGAQFLDRVLHGHPHIDRRAPGHQRPAVEAGQVEQVLDQPRQPPGIAQRHLDAAALALVQVAEDAVVQVLERPEDGGQRRAQFVRQGGDELVFQGIGDPQLLVGLRQLDAGGVEVLEDRQQHLEPRRLALPAVRGRRIFHPYQDLRLAAGRHQPGQPHR